MKHRTAAKALLRPSRGSQRTRDLKALLNALNTWANAPDSGQRTKALRTALRDYQQGVKTGAYQSIGKKICAPTAACNETPTGDFVEFFGDSE